MLFRFSSIFNTFCRIVGCGLKYAVFLLTVGNKFKPFGRSQCDRTLDIFPIFNGRNIPLLDVYENFNGKKKSHFGCDTRVCEIDLCSGQHLGRKSSTCEHKTA